jgi:hypothetical protein
MKNQFERVLNLVRRTGDTMIVVDKEGDDAYVVMDLDQYEAMLGESAQKPSEQAPAQVSQQEVWDLMQQAGDSGETWDMGQMSAEELADLEQQYREFAARHVQQAIEETQEIVEKVEEIEENTPEFAPEPEPEPEPKAEPEPVEEPEVIEVEPESVQNLEKTEDFETIDADDEFGEEQFYLEPIE